MIYILKTNAKVRGGVEVYSELLYKSLSKKFNLEKIDTFHKNRFLVFLFIALKALKSRSKKLLIHHGGFFEVILIFFFILFRKEVFVISHVNKSWKHIRNKYLLSLTNRIFANNNVKLILISEIQRDIFPSSIGVLGSIVSEDFFELPVTSCFVKDDYILFLGRISEDKGIIDLIYAYHKLTNNDKVALIPKLILAGAFSNQNFEKKVNTLVSALDLKDKIKFIGAVNSTEEKIKLIDNSLFGINPSYYDTFPLVMLEFISRNRPIIMSDVSESKFILENCNMLVTPGDISDIVRVLEYWLDKSSPSCVPFDIRLSVNNFRGERTTLRFMNITKAFFN